MSDALLLVLAGVGAGLTGSMAGLASLVSYPAMLAVGLPPLAANVSNTVGLLANGVGTAVGSRRELRGQGRRLALLAVLAGTGGALGAALLLTGDESTFERIVPVLVLFGALLILFRDRIRTWAERRRATRGTPTAAWKPALVIVLVGVYGGYFGAGAGIIMLAVLSVQHLEPLAVTNAVKNIGTTMSNAVAAVGYMLFAPVDWNAAGLLAIGALVGGWTGPQIVRLLPETPLRWTIGAAGIGLAVYLSV